MHMASNILRRKNMMQAIKNCVAPLVASMEISLAKRYVASTKQHKHQAGMPRSCSGKQPCHKDIFTW